MNAIESYRKVAEAYNTPEATFDFFSMNSGRHELGIVFIDTRTKKLDIRGENTPSTVCKSNLRYHDFGTGESGDVINLIQENTSCSFIEAVEKVLEWEGSSIDIKRTVAPVVKKDNTKKANPYTTAYLQKRLEEREDNKERFQTLLSDLCRACSTEDKDAAIKAFNIGMVSYIQKDTNKKVERLFIPEYDEAKTAWSSYSYNREEKECKGLLRRNAKRVLFGSHLVKYFDKTKPIILSEGHSDVIVNIGKYLQCVTNGSSTKSIKEWLPFLKGRELHIYPDMDYPGIKGATCRALEIEEFNKTAKEEDKISYQVFLWSDSFIEETVDEFKNLSVPMKSLKGNKGLVKYAKSWWAELFNDSTLTSTIDRKVMAKAQMSILKKMKEQNPDLVINCPVLVKKWKILSKEPCKKGFDFIDFHEKNKNKPNYEDYISKYKFK